MIMCISLGRYVPESYLLLVTNSFSSYSSSIFSLKITTPIEEDIIIPRIMSQPEVNILE